MYTISDHTIVSPYTNELIGRDAPKEHPFTEEELCRHLKNIHDFLTDHLSRVVETTYTISDSEEEELQHILKTLIRTKRRIQNFTE